MSSLLQRLRVYQFRCHREYEIALEPGATVFLGPNGSGKTSILEAIYLISRLRSFRTTHLKELPFWGKSEFRVELNFREETLGLTWRDGQRALDRNGEPCREIRAFWGTVPTVLFTPEDQNIVSGGASLRRHWMDHLLAQEDASYLELAQRYQRVLQQRNAWLREERPDEEVGKALTKQLSEWGHQMTARRWNGTERVQAELLPLASEIGLDALEIEISYRPGLPDAPDWAGVRERERRFHQTVLGPHRDEWRLTMQGRLVSDFGSQGQQRLLALTLRIVEARLLRLARGHWPVLLIDDVTHSLDDERRRLFHQFLPEEAQRLITLPSARHGDYPEGARLVEMGG